MVRKGEVGHIAYILALVGGILMVIVGLLDLIGRPILMLAGIGGSWFGGFGAIFTVILGIVAIIGSKRVTDLLWAIILIVIGLIGGGWPGNLLVLIGGILGLIAHFV